jgi:hypothetical protein
VRQVLAKQPGVSSVNVDFPKRIATLHIDKSTFNADVALAALVDHGFEHSKLKTDNSPVTPTLTTATAINTADTNAAAPPLERGESNN